MFTGVFHVSGGAGYPSAGNCFWTTPNKIILTMSLKTPSPYIIEKSFGDFLKSTIEIAAITSLEHKREHILKISYGPISSLWIPPPKSGGSYLVRSPASEAAQNITE